LEHGEVSFWGHTEKPDATNHDPAKHRCPGRFLDMDKLREEVSKEIDVLRVCQPNPGFVLGWE
jgi:hypothetical protein